MASFQRSELLRQPLPSSTSLRRRYFLSSLLSAYRVPMSGLVPCVWTVYEIAGPVLPDGFDVAASLVLTVAAAVFRVHLDVAASLMPAVAAAAVCTCPDVAASSSPAVEAAAFSFRVRRCGVLRVITLFHVVVATFSSCLSSIVSYDFPSSSSFRPSSGAAYCSRL